MPSPNAPVAPAGRLRANLLCMASMMAWASGLPAAEILIAPFGLLPLTAARMALAALVLLPIWALAEGRGLRAAPWARGLWIGGLGFGTSAFCLVLGQKHSDAVTVAIISATMPAVGLALELLLDRRRLTWRLALGLILGLLGGAYAYLDRALSLGFNLGALATFGSVLAYTLASRLTVTQMPGLSPLGRTTITQTGAMLSTALAALLAAALGAEPPTWAAIGAPEWGALFIFAVFGMALAQLLWLSAVGPLGVMVAGLHGNAAPFYVMGFVWALGGGLAWAPVFGALLVAGGVLLAQSAPPRYR